MELVPSVGRIVHYFDHHGLEEPQAAIIVRINSIENVDLVLHSSSTGDPAYQRRTGRPFAEEPTVGHWSWPTKL